MDKFINYKNEEYDIMHMSEDELMKIEYDLEKDRDQIEKIIDQILGL